MGENCRIYMGEVWVRIGLDIGEIWVRIGSDIGE